MSVVVHMWVYRWYSSVWCKSLWKKYRSCLYLRLLINIVWVYTFVYIQRVTELLIEPIINLCQISNWIFRNICGTYTEVCRSRKSSWYLTIKVKIGWVYTSVSRWNFILEAKLEIACIHPVSDHFWAVLPFYIGCR